MRIMTVDDSIIVRKIIKVAAENLEYDFAEAVNGIDALNVLESLNGKVDLILLDWNMPAMDGYELLLKLKSTDQYKHIPVVMVTTECEKEKIISAIKAGAVQYIMKPFTMEELLKKINESLGRGWD